MCTHGCAFQFDPKGAALLPQIPTASLLHLITSLIVTHFYEVGRGKLNASIVASYHSPSHHWSTTAETKTQND